MNTTEESRSGFCPVGIIPQCEAMTELCADDNECEEGHKCCQIGCEMRCAQTLSFPPPQQPLPDPASRPGSCAVSTINVQSQ